MQGVKQVVSVSSMVPGSREECQYASVIMRDQSPDGKRQSQRRWRSDVHREKLLSGVSVIGALSAQW